MFVPDGVTSQCHHWDLRQWYWPSRDGGSLRLHQVIRKRSGTWKNWHAALFADAVGELGQVGQAGGSPAVSTQLLVAIMAAEAPSPPVPVSSGGGGKPSVKLFLARLTLQLRCSPPQVADGRRLPGNRLEGVRSLRAMLVAALPEWLALSVCLDNLPSRLAPLRISVGSQKMNLELAPLWQREAQLPNAADVVGFRHHWENLLQQGYVTSSVERPDLGDFLAAALMLPSVGGLVGPADRRRRPAVATMAFALLSQLALGIDNALPVSLSARGGPAGELPVLCGPSGTRRRANKLLVGETTARLAKRLRSSLTNHVAREMEVQWNLLYMQKCIRIFAAAPARLEVVIDGSNVGRQAVGLSMLLLMVLRSHLR